MPRNPNQGTPFPTPINTVLAASAQATISVNFDGNRIWRLEGLSSFSTSRYTLQIVDQGSGESLFQAALRDDTICAPVAPATYGLRPYWFPSFYWVTGPNGIRVVLADISAGQNTISLVLHGSYVPYDGYMGVAGGWRSDV